MIRKINYADKSVGGKFTASDANEIKTSINSNADVLSENSQSILSLQGGSLGSIKPTDAAPTPGRNGNYTFSIGGNKPEWLTAEAGVTEVKAGDGVAVVYTAPSTYSYTHVDVGSEFLTKTHQELSLGEKSIARLNIDAVGIDESINRLINVFSKSDDEYIGYNTNEQNGCGYFMPILETLKFNQIKLKGSIYGAGSAVVTIRIYQGDSIVGLSSPDTNFTLLEEVIQNWSSGSIEDLKTVPLVSLHEVIAGKYLFVLFSTKSSVQVQLKKYNSDPNADRNQIVASTSTVYSNIFNETWILGGAWGTPLKLDVLLPSYAMIQKPRITLPSKIYAVVGTELNLWYDALVLGSDSGLNSPKEYKVEVISTVGKQKERCYSITPIAGDVGTKALTINVYDYNHSLLATKTISLIIIAATAPSAVKNIVMIGDSLLGDNVISPTTQANFAALGSNMPIFRGFSGTSPSNHQGIGGWTYVDYATAGPSYYKFTVSGITTLSSGAVYSNNGSEFTIREVNITSGIGYIKGNRTSGTNTPSSSGTLTKVSGTGDATITYSAVVLEAGNPLWNPSTSALDIAYYRNNLGMGATKFDVMTLQLGGNDSFGNSILSDATITTNVINSIKSICTAFIADNATTKIVIQLTTTDGNTLGGWGANYAATASKNIYQKNIWRIRELILLEFDNSAYNANVEVGNAGLVIDRYYGYELQDAAISSRVPTTEKVHVNALHPTASGYQQIGDAYFAQILHLLQ